MRRTAAWLLLAILLPAVSEAKKLRSTLRVHLEANSMDGPVFSTPMRSPSTGKSLAIQKKPTISEQDVIAYTPYPAADGSFGVLYQLSDHGKLALDTLSVEKRGTNIYIFVNGRGVAELQIDRRVSDGKLYVASGLSQKDLDLMKKDWPLIGQRKK